MSKILVTGASGYTGTALCRRLVEDGEQVVAFIRPTSRIDSLKALGVECRIVDIKNAKDVCDNFSDVKYVYHIAAAFRTEHADQNEFRLVNVEATRYLLDAAVAARVKRFVHCSTVGVQGRIEAPPASEEYRFQPGDYYQETKLEGELIARKYFSNGLPGSIFRPVGIYGPGDTRFLKLFRSINQGIFVMVGSGKNLYHLTYIDDLVDGILLVGCKDEALGEIFTLAGETYTSIRELVNMIADVLGKPHPRFRVPFYPVYMASVACEHICRLLDIDPPLYPRRVEFFYHDRAFSIEKAKRLLGFKPKVSLREGLERTVQGYKKRGLI